MLVQLTYRTQVMILDDFLGSGHPQNAPEYRKSYLPNSKFLQLLSAHVQLKCAVMWPSDGYDEKCGPLYHESCPSLTYSHCRGVFKISIRGYIVAGLFTMRVSIRRRQYRYFTCNKSLPLIKFMKLHDICSLLCAFRPHKAVALQNQAAALLTIE